MLRRHKLLVGCALLALVIIIFGASWWNRSPERIDASTEPSEPPRSRINGRVSSSTPSRGSPPASQARSPASESSTPKRLGPKPPPLPRSLEEALRIYPQAEANIRRYIRYTRGGGDSPQFWTRIDDE